MGRMINEEFLREQLEQITQRTGLREYCRQHSLDPGSVCNIIKGRKKMIPSVAAALGYEKKTVYCKQGE